MSDKQQLIAEGQHILEQKRVEYRRKKHTGTAADLQEAFTDATCDDLIEKLEQLRDSDAADTAEPHYDCERCKDAHWLRGRPDPQTGIARAVPCECWHAWFMREKVGTLWPVSRETEALAQTAFQVMRFTRRPGHYFPDHDQPTKAARTAERKQRYALRVVQRFVDVWPKGIVLVFDSDYGGGKTHLLAKIWAAARDAGKTVILTTGPELQRRLTDFEGEGELTIRTARRHLESVDLLLIDEATRYAHKDGYGHFESQEYFALINARFADHKTTVLAGNDIEEKLHGGIVSRAQTGSSAWVDLNGVPDARPFFERRAPNWLGGEKS